MQSQRPGEQALPSVEFDEAVFKRKLGAAIKLLLLFCVVYFTAAIIATREFKDIASIQIMSMPLALYTGLLVFIVGVIVTRMCLNLDRKD